MSRKRKLGEEQSVLDGAEVGDDTVEGEDHVADDDNTDLKQSENEPTTTTQASPDQKDGDPEDAEQNDEDQNVEEQKDGIQNDADQNDADQNDEGQNGGDLKDEGQNDEDQNDDDQNDEDEDEDEDDNIKVTIEEYSSDFKAIQKQSQPAKQPAPLVLQTNQEPIDINYLDEKPWRKPGANIEDYFNYGFDETTWKIYCDKQKHMKAIVDNINEPQETFKIPVINAGPMIQPNSSPYLDVVAQPVAMHQHQHHQQHHPAGGSGRMKSVEEDVKKYEKRHRSSERRHSSKSRERRHDVRSREREREKDTERKRSRSRERRSKDTKSRQRSRSREDDRRSKRHKSSRHA